MKYIKIRIRVIGNTYWNLDVDIPENIKYYHEDILYDIASKYLYENNWEYKWFRVVKDENGDLVRTKE